MSGASSQKIGQMDPCYFLGRREILDWINSVCALNLSKVEQTCTGAIACQLLDSIFPNKVPMSKVDWTAKNDYQYLTNYKVLQNCFAKLNIDKPIVVDKLTRGRYQDNMEFMQWFKGFFDLNASDQIIENYDGVARRAKGKGGDAYTKANGGRVSSSSKPAKRAATKSNKGESKQSSSSMDAKAASSSSSLEAKAATEALEAEAEKQRLALQNIKVTNEELTSHNDELRESLEALEKERDFYFTKLRQVEMHIQDLDGANENPLAQKVLSILYATDNEENDESSEQQQQNDEGEKQSGSFDEKQTTASYTKEDTSAPHHNDESAAAHSKSESINGPEEIGQQQQEEEQTY